METTKSVTRRSSVSGFDEVGGAVQVTKDKVAEYVDENTQAFEIF